MAHHVSGLGISPTSMDPRSHVTDIYVFQSPGDANKTILVLNINPNSPMTEDAVDHESVYEIGVDTDGDAVTDVAFRVRFSPVAGNSQSAGVQLATGRDAATDLDAGETIIADAPVTFDSEARITTAGGFRFFAGLRSDPFFADPVGAGTTSSGPARTSSPTRTSSASCWRSRMARSVRTRGWASGPGPGSARRPAGAGRPGRAARDRQRVQPEQRGQDRLELAGAGQGPGALPRQVHRRPRARGLSQGPGGPTSRRACCPTC